MNDGKMATYRQIGSKHYGQMPGVNRKEIWHEKLFISKNHCDGIL